MVRFRIATATMPRAAALLWLAARVLGSSIIVPIAEELAFRGYLLRRLIDSDFTLVNAPLATYYGIDGVGGSYDFDDRRRGDQNALVDPLLTRVLGAGLLALAFSSFLGWRASAWNQVALIVQVELAYCILGSLAFIGPIILLGHYLPFIGYVLVAILLAFAAAWAWAYRQGTRGE